MPINIKQRELQTLSQLKLNFPTRSKLSPNATITGNRFDIVLACQPNARDNYALYDNIFVLFEDEKKLRIYSPHKDVESSRHTMEETVIFTVREAIPRTRGVLVHLSSVTPQIQKMFDSTYLNSRPFILFYSSDIMPFSSNTERLIKSDPSFREKLNIGMKLTLYDKYPRNIIVC